MKRFSKKLIIANAIRGIVLAAFVFMFVIGLCTKERADESTYIIDNGYLIASIATGVFYILFIIYSYLFVATSGYEFNETGVVCKKGVFFKRKTILDYNKMNAINIKMSLINRICGVYALLIDSGSTNRAELAEICIFDDSNIVKELYDKLKKREIVDIASNEESNEFKYKFKSKAKWFYVLINSFTTFFVLTILLGVLFVLAAIITELNRDSLIGALLIIGGIYLFIVAVIAIVNICMAMVKYYDFNIEKNNDVLEVNYGLIERHKNIININKIKAIKIEQGIAERIFKYCKIKIELIGYVESDNQNMSVGILIPICKLSNVNSLLEDLGIDKKVEEPQYKSNHYLPFVSYSLLFPFIGYALISILLVAGLAANNIELLGLSIGVASIIYGVYALLVLVLAIFQKRAQGITISDDKLVISSGVIIKTTTITNKKNIIGIEDITTKFRRNKGIYSYVIHIHTNALTNTIRVDIVDEGLRDELNNLLIL